ncbi:MAG: ABC transporter ATP-binding protein [Clostridium sp.]|uniref:ABC transporter ATP-binding protein n=1 Tax=Clostridium sp. TaxID=1506 RepID=UPI003D6D42E3
MENVILIKTSNLKKDFDKKSAVNNLNIKVYEGDVYGFLGPNGSGKSTSIKMMLGLVKSTKGKITINGYDIETHREKALEKIGAMVETPKFYENLSGYKNLVLIANLYRLPKSRINEVLEMVGMTSAATKKVSAYSLGMKQRLGIARAFLNNPNIVILDEPTNGLDPQGVKDIRNLIKELSTKYNVTFFISSHILSEIQAICNRVAIINNGELIVENYVDELLAADEEIIEIHTKAKEKASKLLNSLDIPCKIKNFEKGLIATVPKNSFNTVNKILVLNDITLDNLILKNSSLEDYFLKVTEGGKKYA